MAWSKETKTQRFSFVLFFVLSMVFAYVLREPDPDGMYGYLYKANGMLENVALLCYVTVLAMIMRYWRRFDTVSMRRGLTYLCLFIFVILFDELRSVIGFAPKGIIVAESFRVTGFHDLLKHAWYGPRNYNTEMAYVLIWALRLTFILAALYGLKKVLSTRHGKKSPWVYGMYAWFILLAGAVLIDLDIIGDERNLVSFEETLELNAALALMLSTRLLVRQKK